MNFKYIGTNSGGQRVSGTHEASDRFALARELKAQGIDVVSASEVGSSRPFMDRINEKISSISFKEKIFLVGNLSEMLSAGLVLSRALKVSGKQTHNPKLSKVINDIGDSLDKGGSFADALKMFPDVFSHTTIAMVEAGERSGRVPESLKLVSTQMMKTYQLRKRIKGALTYPAIVMGAMVLIAILMLVYIVPTLAATFKELGAELPATTSLIIGFSDFMTNHYLVVLLLVIVFGLGIYYVSKVTGVRRMYAWFILHVPVINNIVKQTNAALTARTMSSLLFSGVDIVEVLTITSNVLRNPYYKEVIGAAITAVPKGQSLSSTFGGVATEKLYPPFVGEMISVGEETGKLPDMLLKLAEFYEGEVDAVVKDLSTVIEPFIMLIVGAGVGFFALAMIQPIYEVGNNI